MLRLEDFKLRPVIETDLPLLLRWRNSERVRSYMYTQHIITAEEHAAWFARIVRDDTVRYDLLEHCGRPVGLNYLTAINRFAAACLWGFYLGETDLPRGSGTVLGYLAMNVAFVEERLRLVKGEVLSFNEPSQRLFRRLGFTEESDIRQHISDNGEMLDIAGFRLERDEWLTSHAPRVRVLFSREKVKA